MKFFAVVRFAPLPVPERVRAAAGEPLFRPPPSFGVSCASSSDGVAREVGPVGHLNSISSSISPSPTSTSISL